MPQNDPLQRYGAPLASVLIAFVLSVLMAAMVAGQIGEAYQTRALVYAGFVLWVLTGAAAMFFMLAHRGEASRLSASRVLLWTATIWLWPIFLLLDRRRRDQNG
ncbi:MAG: hypothetical protein ABJA83_02850 [Burkholderiaceae bacterium]